MTDVFAYLDGFGTGGGGYTGPKVIGSPTQPSNPKDNTVWVQTSTPISSWEMSNVSVPGWDTAPAGFVYFTMDTSDWTIPNLVKFTKGSVGNVFLKATRCWQNLGVPGATQWTSMNAYIYHNDTWTQFSSTRVTPEFTYTGNCEIVDDSDNIISDFATWTDNWKIRFLTSGTLTFTSINGAIDVFLVGGGGGSPNTAANVIASGGGGGGYTVTAANVIATTGTSYSIVVGAGGSVGADGGASSAFGKTTSGGKKGAATEASARGGDGGSGGGGGGAWNAAAGNGGSDGANGTAGSGGAGAGQGATTREFGEPSGKLYSGGGGGGSFDTNAGTGGAGGGADGAKAANGISAAANTGGGAGGAGVVNSSGYTGAKGGSGIVIIRNKR